MAAGIQCGGIHAGIHGIGWSGHGSILSLAWVQSVPRWLVPRWLVPKLVRKEGVGSANCRPCRYPAPERPGHAPHSTATTIEPKTSACFSTRHVLPDLKSRRVLKPSKLCASWPVERQGAGFQRVVSKQVSTESPSVDFSSNWPIGKAISWHSLSFALVRTEAVRSEVRTESPLLEGTSRTVDGYQDAGYQAG